ncbi:MAG: hypothetical protein J1F40_06670 [Prevotellaceae bacterium]|nr:hypothetical protein [Prevotellaceae bacterium]
MEQLKRSKDLAIIYACAIVSSVVLILGWGVLENPPMSPTFINAWNNIIDGKIDVLRTPVYPCFLGIMKTLFGESDFRFATICVQHGIFLVSVYFYYKIAQHLIYSKRIVFIVSFFYATFSLFTTWNNFILTESLAISGIVILTYIITCMRQVSVYVFVISYTSVLFLLIFLRPALVYLLPIFILTWLYLLYSKKGRKIAFYGICGTLIVIIALLSYMKAFEKEYGIFASSRVSVVNQLCIARQYGLLDPDVIQDSTFKSQIIKSYQQNGERCEDLFKDVYPEVKNWIKKYDLTILNNAISNSINNNLKAWIVASGGRFMKSLYYPLFGVWIGYNNTYLNMVLSIFSLDIKLNLKLLYMFLFIYVIVLVFWIVKNHCFPWLSSLLYLACIGNIVVSVIGAQDEWDRLMLPSMPLFLLLLGQFFTMFKADPITNIKFR